MNSIWRRYQKVGKPTLNLVTAEFFLQLLNASFYLILLIHMDKKGYPDHEAAHFISYRFLGVLLTAVPFGMLIKGLRLRPFFIASSITTPILSWVVVHFIDVGNTAMISASLLLWGISFNFFQVGVLPYIIRQVDKNSQTEAITLNFSTWSLSAIVSGILIYVLRSVDASMFSEDVVLKIFSVLSCVGIFFAIGITKSETPGFATGSRFNLKQYDWWIITKALAPTFIIAMGAGLTIPFISVFFYNVHHIDSEQFSLIGAFANVVVFSVAFFIPSIKDKFGFRKAVPTTQGMAVLMLVLLATTEWYSQLSFALILAIVFFVSRQPLMNMAQPMTSEVVMNYVGERNREIVSAITSAIWSGSWFASSIIFENLREGGVSYAAVFLITAGLYAIAVIWYYFLIVDYEDNVLPSQQAN